MAALPHPLAEDVIIHQKPLGTFTIGVSAGLPQIVCSSPEEALQSATGFAARQHVRLWYTDDDRRCAPLADVTLLRKVLEEYSDMPGLSLTPEQAQRLWGVDVATCTSLLKGLVDLKFLACGLDGRYARRAKGHEALPRPHMAKAEMDRPRSIGRARR